MYAKVAREQQAGAAGAQTDGGKTAESGEGKDNVVDADFEEVK
jgi:hypothetical protein